MKTASLLALTALLALGGCSASNEPCTATPGFNDGSFSGPPAFRLGAPASIHVTAAQSFFCEDPTNLPVAESVTAEVFDPDNQRLPSEVSLGVNGTTATVRFTPRTTGRHHVLVAFAPVGSLQQFGAYVARDWSGSPTATLLPQTRCNQLDRTARGTWLCDGVALYEGGRTQRLANSTVPPDVAVAGNVVWAVDPEDRVRRFVDTGTELELTGSLLLRTVGPLQSIQGRLASERELWVLDLQRLHRFIFTDTGVLDAAGSTRWTSDREQAFGVDLVTGVLVRTSPDRVLVVRSTQRPNSEACPFKVGPDGAFAATGEPCLPLPGLPVGYEEGVLWTRSGEPFQTAGQTLQRWVVSDGTLVEQGSLVLDTRIEGVTSPLRAGFIVPDLRLGTFPVAYSALPVASPEQGPLGLELLPDTATLGTELRTVSPRFYWEGDIRQNNASTVVYERSPVP